MHAYQPWWEALDLSGEGRDKAVLIPNPADRSICEPRTVASTVPRQQRNQSPGEREPERPLCERTPGGIGVSGREAHRSADNALERMLLSQTGNTKKCVYAYPL